MGAFYFVFCFMLSSAFFFMSMLLALVGIMFSAVSYVNVSKLLPKDMVMYPFIY